MAKQTIENIFYINAPAGTGKTYNIMEKIIHSIQEDNQARILCITYTNRAADELKERVETQVIVDDNIEIGTIHSFLNQILTQYKNFSEVKELYIEIFKEEIEERIAYKQKELDGCNEKIEELNEEKKKIIKTISDMEKGDDLSLQNNKDEITECKKKIEEIDEKILKEEEKKEENANIKYLNKIGVPKDEDLTVELIRENLDKVYYNERNYNSVFYGGISHDSLLVFIKKLFDKFPALQDNFSQRYTKIFIDECQDNSADILFLFYNIVKGRDVELYLYGDKMQEIYDKYNGSFEEIYEQADQSIILNKNYRSTKEIVNLLDNLYGFKNQDPKFTFHKEEKGKKPKLILTNDLLKDVENFRIEHEGFLHLRVFNKDRFKRDEKEEDMSLLFDAYSKIYTFLSSVSVIDALIPEKGENSPDDLLNFLYLMDEILDYYRDKNYGLVIQALKNDKIFNVDNLKVSYHKNKLELNQIIETVLSKYHTKEDTYTIGCFLKDILEIEFFTQSFYDFLRREDDRGIDYSEVLKVPLFQFVNLAKYRAEPDISTQHGVKGEGHDKICFVAEDAKNTPYIYMYDFLNMYTHFMTNKQAFDVVQVQQLYYDFNARVTALEKEKEIKVRELKKADLDDLQVYKIVTAIIEDYKNNPYYYWVFETNTKKKDKHISKYETNKKKNNIGIGNVKKLLRPEDIGRILIAYKLFYVGCSRAKEELVVFIDMKKINEIEMFITAMSEIGFQVVHNSTELD